MFTFAIVLLVITAIIFLLTRAIPKDEPGARTGGRVAVGFFVFLTLVVMLLASLSTVPTKNVGIVTSFGKPTGSTTGPGLHLHAPWQKIDDWDASRNTFDRLGKNCLWVSISGGRACIAVQVEWSAIKKNAPDDWASYKPTKINGENKSRFETFVARRVNPQMDAAITTTFTTFDPLGTLEGSKSTATLKAPDLNKEYKETLKNQLQANLGGSVTIDSVAFGTPSYDDSTTKAISAYGQKTLEARNLAVDQQNAETRLAITNTDAKADPIARCLSIAEKLNKEPGLCMTPTTATRSVN